MTLALRNQAGYLVFQNGLAVLVDEVELIFLNEVDNLFIDGATLSQGIFDVTSIDGADSIFNRLDDFLLDAADNLEEGSLRPLELHLATHADGALFNLLVEDLAKELLWLSLGDIIWKLTTLSLDDVRLAWGNAICLRVITFLNIIIDPLLMIGR